MGKFAQVAASSRTSRARARGPAAPVVPPAAAATRPTRALANVPIKPSLKPSTTATAARKRSRAATGLNTVAGRKAARRTAFKRPAFSTQTYRLGTEAYNKRQPQSKRLDPKNPPLQASNLALPHRAPWKYIRERTEAYLAGHEDEKTFRRWTDRMRKAATAKATSGMSANSEASQRHVADALELHGHRENLIAAMAKNDPNRHAHAETFLKRANDFFANVPDLGPHRGVNLQTGANFHLHVAGGALTPMSREAISMTPRAGYGVAMSAPGQLLTTEGTTYPTGSLTPRTQADIARHGVKLVN